MMVEPKVTVGMTSYNRPQGLRKCLSSMLKQTYPHFVIHLSIDCSEHRDNVISAIKDLLSDSRVALISPQHNLGMHGNIRSVLEGVTTPYFCWADDDDFHEPAFLEKGVAQLEDSPKYQAWFPTMDNVTKGGVCFQKYPSFTRFTSTVNKDVDVIKFLREPEIRGKCNMMYSLFRTEALRQTVAEYFLNDTWGTDNSMMLAFITRFNIVCSEEVLFHKGNYDIPENHGCGSAESRACQTGSYPKEVEAEYLSELLRAADKPYKQLVKEVMQMRSNWNGAVK